MKPAALLVLVLAASAFAACGPATVKKPDVAAKESSSGLPRHAVLVQAHGDGDAGEGVPGQHVLEQARLPAPGTADQPDAGAGSRQVREPAFHPGRLDQLFERDVDLALVLRAGARVERVGVGQDPDGAVAHGSAR